MLFRSLGEIGFRIVIFPGGTVRFLARQLQGYFATLKHDGSTAALQDRMHDFDGLNAVIGTPELTIPHPAMLERRFVLEPLAELAPDLRSAWLEHRSPRTATSRPRMDGYLDIRPGHRDAEPARLSRRPRGVHRKPQDRGVGMSTPEKNAAFQADLSDPRHGTLNGYKNLDCRCDPCKAANSAGQADY